MMKTAFRSILPELSALSLVLVIGCSGAFAQTPGGHENEHEKLYEEAVSHYTQAERGKAMELFSRLSGIYAEESDWESLVDVLSYKALISFENRELEKSRKQIQRAIELAEQKLEKGHPYFSTIYSIKAYQAEEQNDHETALEWVRKSIETIESVEGEYDRHVRAWGVKGYVLDSYGDYSEAIEAYKRGLDLAEKVDDEEKHAYSMTLILNNLGVAYRKAGDPEAAMQYYRMNRDYLEKLFHSGHPELAMNYNNMGAVYFSMGDIALAAQHFLRAASILEDHYGRNHQLVAAAYNNAGTSYFRLGQTDNAFRYLELAQEIKINVLGTDHLDTAVGHSNLASLYQSQGRYDEAVENFERSIEIRLGNFGRDHPSLISPYMQRSDLYIKINEPKSALKDVDEAIRIGYLRMDSAHPDIVEGYVKRGDIYRSMKRFKPAFASYQKAISRITEQFDSDDIHDNPRHLSTAHPLILLQSLSGKAKLMNEFYLLNRNRDYLKTAFNTYMLALELVEKLQFNFQHEASKLNLLGDNFSIFEGAMLSAYNLYRVTGEEEYLDAAFSISEQSKARIANELFQESEARKIAGIPERVIEEERKMNEAIASLHLELTLEKEKEDDRDPALIRTLQDSLFEKHQEQQAWIDRLEGEYPSYFEMKYERNTLSLSDVRNHLISEGQAALNYLMGEEHLFVMFVSREEAKIFKLNAPEEIPQTVEQLRSSLVERDSGLFRSTASGLYESLIGPLKEQISGHEELLILPDHLLYYIPFELLLAELPGHDRFNEWEYLIRDYKVSYAPSLTIYRKMRSDRQVNTNRMLALAPLAESSVTFDEESPLRDYTGGLPPLPVTRYETERIAELFRTQRRFWNPFTPAHESVVLLNEEATRSVMLESDLYDYGYLHFATHAFVHESDPALSGIVLADDGSGETVIYQNDIYNLNLNADLLVLSACDTGLGSLARGEGMIGFTRAFINSGVHNLIVSLWKVSDRQTSELMVRFYVELLDGYGKSEALRNAKLSIIERPGSGFPADWASFVLIGN